MTIREILDKFDITSERESFETIHETVEKGIQFRGTNLWILIFAILIACVGLNVNSTAVIIGAMLISPLMGPILGMGYSLATYDFLLFRNSLVNFIFAVLSSLVASTLYFAITPLGEAHSELLARTRPNIYDVLIALGGGLAGVTAISSKNKGNVIPGVAIATALMPPLCTAGYGLATGSWSFFFGAFYLFTINTVFIAAATMYTVRLLNYPIWHQPNQMLKKRADRWVTMIILVTVIPSIYFGYQLVEEERFRNSAKNFIRFESRIEGDYLLDTEIDPASRSLKLTYGGKIIPDSVMQAVKNRGNNYGIEAENITIALGFSLEDYNQHIGPIDAQTAELRLLKAQLLDKSNKLDSANRLNQLGSQLLAELKPMFPEIKACGVSEQTVYRDPKNRQTYLSLFIESSSPRKTLAQRAKLTAWLRTRTGTDSVKVYIE